MGSPFLIVTLKARSSLDAYSLAGSGSGSCSNAGAGAGGTTAAAVSPS